MYAVPVSIVMPVHNSALYLRQAIDSIIDQTYSQWQCLIVDDCSTDNSSAIIQDYLNKDKRFRCLRTQQQSGPAIARNLAIEHIQGRYICFLDSDDFWYPNKLEQQLAFVQQHQCAICYSAFDRVDSEGALLRFQATREKTDYRRSLYNNLLNTCSVMLDRTQLKDIRFPESLGHEDLGLWLQLLKQVPYALGVQQSLLAYRIHQNSRNIGLTKRFIHQWQVYLKQEKFSFIQALWLFSLHTYSGFSKRRLEGLVGGKSTAIKGSTIERK